MMGKQFFIRTQNEDTKNQLIKNGFTFMNKEGKFYIFVNDGKMNFSEDVRKDLFYTDKLTF